MDMGPSTRPVRHGASWASPHQVWNVDWLSLVQVSSWVQWRYCVQKRAFHHALSSSGPYIPWAQWPCHVQRTAFHSTLQSSALTFFLPPLPWHSLSLGIIIINILLRLIIPSHFSELEPVRYQSVSTIVHCKKKLHWPRLRATCLWVQT